MSTAIARDLPSDYRWPGNVRELEQCVRRVLLTGAAGPLSPTRADVPNVPEWLTAAAAGSLDARGLLAAYCGMLRARLGSFEEVARVTGLDRRTVKKYVDAATRE